MASDGPEREAAPEGYTESTLFRALSLAIQAGGYSDGGTRQPIRFSLLQYVSGHQQPYPRSRHGLV